MATPQTVRQALARAARYGASAMRPLGYTLLLVAILLHLSVCEWQELGNSQSRIVWRIHAREQFRLRDPRPNDYVPPPYNVMAAGFSGLIVPALVAGIGLLMILRPESHLATTAPASPNPKLVPCPDCGRQVSRLATSCPQCGRPFTSAQQGTDQ
jgi:hypothetical protein